MATTEGSISAKLTKVMSRAQSLTTANAAPMTGDPLAASPSGGIGWFKSRVTLVIAVGVLLVCLLLVAGYRLFSKYYSSKQEPLRPVPARPFTHPGRHAHPTTTARPPVHHAPNTHPAVSSSPEPKLVSSVEEAALSGDKTAARALSPSRASNRSQREPVPDINTHIPRVNTRHEGDMAINNAAGRAPASVPPSGAYHEIVPNGGITPVSPNSSPTGENVLFLDEATGIRIVEIVEDDTPSGNAERERLDTIDLTGNATAKDADVHEKEGKNNADANDNSVVDDDADANDNSVIDDDADANGDFSIDDDADGDFSIDDDADANGNSVIDDDELILGDAEGAVGHIALDDTEVASLVGDRSVEELLDAFESDQDDDEALSQPVLRRSARLRSR